MIRQRIALFALLFFTCSLAAPYRSRAVVPLAVIAPAAIGASLLTLAVGGVITKVALNMSGKYGVDTSSITVPIAAYNTYVSAGASVALGYVKNIKFDFSSAWNSGLCSAYNGIKAVANVVFPPSTRSLAQGYDGIALPPGSILSYNFTAPKVAILTYSHTTAASISTLSSANEYLSRQLQYDYGYVVRFIGPLTWGTPDALKYNFFKEWYYVTLSSTETATPEAAGPPAVLTPETAAPFVAALADAAETDSALKQELDNLVKDTPGLLTPPPSITNDQVADYAVSHAAQSAVDAAQDAADVAAAAVAANPTKTKLEALHDAAVAAMAAAAAAVAANPLDLDLVKALDAAKVQEQEAKNLLAADPSVAILQAAANKAAADLAAAQAAAQAAIDAADNAPAPETFSPVGTGAFGTAYNPGAFDIPARFTAFVNTVKASPLFSFSTGFFNSLPGGGSPLYEIDAGQYGHHTVDLSQTMSTGLAVLKTILLACFGFLSIRAVIMKR